MFENQNNGKADLQQTDEALNLHQKAQEVMIVDEESAKHALSISLQSRKLRASMEEIKSAMVKPFLEYHKRTCQTVKMTSDMLVKIEDKLTSSLRDWLYKKNQDPFNKISCIEVEEGKLFCKDEWVFEITDLHKIPKKYFTLDSKLISDDIKRGIRNLDGVSIFQSESITLRLKN